MFLAAPAMTPAVQRQVGTLSSSYCHDQRLGAARRKSPPQPRLSMKQAAQAKMYVPTDSFGGLSPEKVAANVLKKVSTFASLEIIRIREEANAEEAETPAHEVLDAFMQKFPYKPSDDWTNQLTSSGGDLKLAALKLLQTREEFAQDAFDWNLVKSLTIESLKEEDAELMEEYMMKSMLLGSGENEEDDITAVEKKEDQ